MANAQITKYITVCGDVGLKPAGEPLYALRGGKIQWNVSVGEPVAYLTTKGTIPETIGVADLTDANKHRFRFGVGHSSDKTGVVDSIRHLGAEDIGNCDIEDMSVNSPKCGNPEVHDLYFDCVECGETYTINIGVRDNFTQSYTKAHKDYADWWLSYTPNCSSCKDCDTDITCEKVVDGLMEQFHQPNGLTLPNGRPYPDYRGTRPDYPFDLHKIYGRGLIYCLAFNTPETDCENCTELPAFADVTVGGETIDLSGLVTPTDDTAIFRAQLEQVAAIINEAFEDSEDVNGRAYITGVNYNQCCPIQLHINTDDADLAIVGVDGPLVPIETNPFAEGEPGEGFTCGLRVISAPLSGSCECLITKPLAMYGRKVRIDAVGDGFQDSHSEKIQKMELPAQFGALVQYEELLQDRGGSGRTYSGGNQVGGWLGGPREDSFIRNASTAKCEKDYCTYRIRSRKHHLNSGHRQDSRVINSFINVESDATTANAEIKELLDKLAELSIFCADVPEIECTPLSVACGAEGKKTEEKAEEKVATKAEAKTKESK